jgi:hypothetical protein
MPRMSSKATTSAELIYDEGCPNIAEARGNLLRAFQLARVEAHWTEWNRQDPATPARVRGFASPTVLVGGRDVAGGQPGGTDPCCRLYAGPQGEYRRAPEASLIAEALREVELHRARAVRPEGLLVLPGIASALLPKLACPACWPAYAGLLSAVGLGFLLSARYLLAITALLLAAAVGGIAFGARRRRRYGPLFLGLTASGIVLAGKFYYDSEIAVYLGIAGLVFASLWNARHAPTGTRAPCPTCVPIKPRSTPKRSNCHESQTQD